MRTIKRMLGESTRHLKNTMDIQRDKANRSGHVNWRQSNDYFSEGPEFPSGSINLSPAWYQQAHDVSKPFFFTDM
jgi:hypothetical protein